MPHGAWSWSNGQVVVTAVDSPPPDDGCEGCFEAVSGCFPLEREVRLPLTRTPSGRIPIADNPPNSKIAPPAIDTPQNCEFLKAAADGDTRAVQELLKAGVDPNNTTTDNATPLCYAAYYGHAATVKALLAGGASSDGCEQEHTTGTPLFHAARRGHLECVRVLVNAGANKDWVNTGHYKGKAIDVVCDSSDGMDGPRDAIIALLS